MKFRKLRSEKLSEVKISNYYIDWDKDSCSSYQTKVKRFLKRFWTGQLVLEEFRIPGSLYRIDIINLNKKIAIEVDGEFHEEYSEFAHRGSRTNWWKQMRRDEEKRKWCEECGYIVIQITPDDIPNLSPEWFKENYNIIL